MQVPTSRPAATSPAGSITVFIGAAGGAGASFIATNVAHMLATAGNRSTALVDLDLEFAPLSHYLDLRPMLGLTEALDALAGLSAPTPEALAPYGAHHSSGLRLLCAAAGRPVSLKDIPPGRLALLLELLTRQHRHVVVDMPHGIDRLHARALEMASQVYVVLQQSVLHLRNTLRLAQILLNELQLPMERLKFVLNRYSKAAIVDLDDVRRALDGEPVHVVPNHFKMALQSVDSGIPMYEEEPTAPVTRALLEIYAEIAGKPRARRTEDLLHRAALPC